MIERTELFLECEDLIQNLTTNHLKAPKPLPTKWEFEYSFNVECVEGYKFVTDQPSTNMSCQSDGNWSMPLPSCQRKGKSCFFKKEQT
jgi:hypothetical protein